MKLGFITNSLVNAGMKDLDSLACWAAENGFSDLEVGPTVPLAEEEFHKTKEAYGVDINTLIYCRNFLISDVEQAKLLLDGLTERIIFAGKAGVKQVVTTTGISEKSFPEGNYRPDLSLEAFCEVFEPVIELAEQYKVDVLLETCPMMGNIAVSPYMWDLIFNKVKSKRLGIAYDPSHLVWQGIDPYKPIAEYMSKIHHVHGKDCELNWDAIKRTGTRHMFGPAAGNNGAWVHKDAGLAGGEGKANLWWRYRLPGLGELDWSKIISRLYEAGFDGTVSIEHEDPVWSGGDRVKRGIIAARKHIEQYLV